MRVALFITCLADAMFPDVGRATVTVLERLGHQVEFPAAQTCCGQMHVNTGYQKQALPLVERFASVFAPYDAVVAPSGSCVGSIRHQHRMIAERFGRADLVEQVDAVAAKTFELSELLVDVLGVTEVGAYFPHRVTYHPTCHSLRMLRVGDKPLQLLRAVDGIDLVALPEADQCCGFGGTFAIKNADTSIAMLADKMQNVVATERRDLHRRGQFVPDAHRWWTLPDQGGSPDSPSGPDPGLDPSVAAPGRPFDRLRARQGKLRTRPPETCDERTDCRTEPRS